MNPKKLKALKKQAKPAANKPQNGYIKRMSDYAEEYNDYPKIKWLINHVLQADRLLQRGLLPQELPELILPEDIQDDIYRKLGEQYPAGDKTGDRLWDQLSGDLPKLDTDLRNFRDYLEEHYGMWAYISTPFIKSLAEFIDGRPALEVMAGNGYISKGLRDLKQNVIATDSKSWTTENETGKHTVTEIEQLGAVEAFGKYQNDIEVVIMSWSPDGQPVDKELLDAIRASDKAIDFVVIGEMNGATDSKAFWDSAEFVDNDDVKALNAHFVNFDLIHDHVFLVK